MAYVPLQKLNSRIAAEGEGGKIDGGAQQILLICRYI